MNYYLFFSVALIILGIIGIFTFLPGPILVLAGIVLYGWSTDFTVISLNMIIIFGLLTLVGILFDYLASFISAKRYNISTPAIGGMIIGGLVGFFVFSLMGLIFGQFLGILLGELLSGKNITSSLKSGTASLVGYVLSIAVNIMIVGVMVGYFSYMVLRRG